MFQPRWFGHLASCTGEKRMVKEIMVGSLTGILIGLVIISIIATKKYVDKKNKTTPCKPTFHHTPNDTIIVTVPDGCMSFYLMDDTGIYKLPTDGG